MIADDLSDAGWKIGRPRTEMKGRSRRAAVPSAKDTPDGGLKVAKEGRDDPQLFFWDTRDLK